ncbi:hypothetical protein J1614_011715 [Plenodomus biglobosus]|nr:hypothetical protein J1614_011715 [Plenodomus biglobosus]
MDRPRTPTLTQSNTSGLMSTMNRIIRLNSYPWPNLKLTRALVNASMGVSPFYATKGYDLRSGVEPPQPLQGNTPARHKQEEAN